MDNNSNFEQQVAQSVKATTVPPTMATAAATTNTNKLPLIIAIVLAVITLIESIALIITSSNYSALLNRESNEEYEAPVENDFVDEAYAYDDDYNLTALSFVCTAEDGSRYILGIDNKYEQYNGGDSLVSSGSYTISNDALISLSDNNKVLYYDGINIADGLTVYNCEEVAAEAGADDVDTE